MNRRSFLQTILIAGCAPAIVRADSLMRIVPRDTELYIINWRVEDWLPRTGFGEREAATLRKYLYYPPNAERQIGMMLATSTVIAASCRRSKGTPVTPCVVLR